jgi:hypothetical protein
MESIFSQIRKEATDFYDNYISIVPGYSFNQNETLKRIHLYLNSKYEDGTQYLGRDKLFYNIIQAPCEVAMRMLNIDTKNIRLLPLNPKSYFSTYLLEKELKQWLKKNKLGKVLNQLAEEAPRYGSVVLQKTKDGAEVVDLRRLILDPSVENINKSRFVTTVHYMKPTELRDTSWDNVDIAIERFGESNAQEPFQDQMGNTGVMTSTPYIKIHKRWGEVPAWQIDNSKKPGTKSGDEMVKSLFIVAGADFQEQNSEGKPIGELGVILFKSRWYKEFPFKDFHYTKIKGRWLGLGVVEMLFDVQVRMNELKNQKRISMEISAMHLFQTPDKQIVRNLLTDLESGDMLISANGITPVDNQERNLPAFDSEEASFLGQADRLSFAYEAIRGQEPNSNTTLGQTQIQTANATSVYAFKKENLALFLQDFFNDLVMPNLMKDLTPEHIMRFTGSVQELEKLDKAASEVYANDLIKEKILNGESAYTEDLEGLKQKAIETYRELSDSRFLKIKDAFYDDANFEFDFLITNEQDDLQVKAQNYQLLMTTMINAVPTGALNDPRVKLTLSKFAEQLGISQAEFELADQQATDQQQQLQAQGMQLNSQPMPQLAQPQNG